MAYFLKMKYFFKKNIKNIQMKSFCLFEISKFYYIPKRLQNFCSYPFFHLLKFIFIINKNLKKSNQEKTIFFLFQNNQRVPKKNNLLQYELISVQFTEHDYQNQLSKQKGLIEYLQFRLSIEEQTISQEEQDLELIEKELGELFIEESPYQLRLEKIIEGLAIDESLKNVIEEKFSISEQRLEKDKFNNFLSQLRKIKDSGKYQNIHQIKIEYWDQLAIQTTTVIKTLETFGQIDKEIFQMLLNEELMNLKRLLSEEKIYSEIQLNAALQSNQEKMINEKDKITITTKSDQIQENQSHDLIVKQKENYQINEKDVITWMKSNFFSNLNRRTYLLFLIKVVKLQIQKIIESKELLQRFLEEVNVFSDKLDQIQKYKQEVQTKLQQRFQCRFQEFIKNFEQLILTQINLQQIEDENFESYFERIQTNLSKGNYDTEITQTQQNISDFLKTLKVYFSEKLLEPKYSSNSHIKQEFLIECIRKLYLLDNQEEEYDEKSDQQLGLFDTLKQKYHDFQNNEEWKIKQGLVFTIIQISSNCFTDTIISFCQKSLIQLWVSEKDLRVRTLLKNKNLINMQMQILQRDWQTQHDRIASEMQQMLKKIDQLQEQIFHEANLNKRELQLKQIDETTLQLDEYIENINEMGQQLQLITDFVNHIRKGLLRVEGKMNEMKESLINMSNEIKLLRGKSVEQLLEIRKWKVLMEAAYKNVRSIYVPLKTQEKGKNELSNLMNLEQFDDKVGEVNKFLQEEKTVLLIHGITGSGKSTTTKKIEEFIWKQHDKNKQVPNQVLIPIYISLPSLNNPNFQAIEETLRQDDYGFDDIQLKECKEMLEKKEFRFLFIMDSYDEMKLENLQKNLYINNKIKQNWSDPLVIFTTRSEILTSINYIDWFAPEDKTKLKEIQLLKFDQAQKEEYLKKFTLQSIKMLIIEMYEQQIQIENRRAMDINKFELFWEK